MVNKYKTGFSLLALLLLLVAQQGGVDRFGMHYTESSFNRALLTFAVARSLNGVISVAQGTEVAVQPAGVGINFAPGQILDPVNDLIERFSWVMLASTTSLGLQKLLLQIFGSPHFTLLLALVMATALALLWHARVGWEVSQRFFYRAMLLLLVLRFSVPVVALGSELLFTTFLQQQYEHSTQSIDIEATLQQYQQAAANVSEQLIQLIVIFVLQTVVLPLLFLWGIGRLLRHVMAVPLPALRG
jgi:hypothetical protein